MHIFPPSFSTASFRIGPPAWAFMLAWLLPVSILAAVTESFDSITDASYGTPDDYGAWFATNSMVSTDATKARGGSGRCLVFDDDAGAYLLYEGADGNGKDGGLGTVSIWYRHWNGSGNVAFQAEYRQGTGSWVNLGSEIAVSSTNYAQFTADANVSGDNIQVRFRSTAYAERLCFDDVFLGDLSGPAEDPNLVAPATLLFGTLSPGASATQLLALANTGTSNTLNLSSLSPVSGDTTRFSAGALPASLAPGATAAVAVVYSPGAVTGASHSAIFRLVSNDPSSPTQSLTFSGQTIGAALTISNIQYSAGGTSPYSGSRVTVSGIATYADTNGYAIADPAGGPWSGIYVSDVIHRPEHGDHVALEALVQETAAMTTLSAVSNYTTLATGLSVSPTTIRGNQLATEAYEGVYVRITNATVNNVNVNNQSNTWQATDGTSFLVNTRVPYRYIWTNNARLSAIQGIVHVNNSTISLSPRNDRDFIGRPMFEYALRGLVITPDGPRTNWTVHVRDDLIVTVTNIAIPGIPNIDTGGILFPGLLDAHNHPSYNSFPTLMFNNFPFGHRDQWGEEDTEYEAWKDKRNSLRSTVSDASQDLITKYGECLELMAGCIAIQGQSNTDTEHSHPSVILYNIEQFPSRTWQNIFPWTMTNSTTRATLLAKIAGGAVNATMIHLCEGIDSTARDQFNTWRNWGMLNDTTAIIHGAALQPADFAQMAAAGAKLIWSPMSNMKLYGGTANVKAAHDAGVLIGLSPDWTPSGCFNILEELGYAWELNTTVFSNAFTPREMAEMVTLNNAKCAGLFPRYGQIAPGANAGLCVIEGDPDDPYMALIRARPASVLLTIVDGTPRYGDPDLMAALGVTGESLDVKGHAKKINIAVTHPFLDYSDMTFAQIRSALQTGHATLTPTAVLNPDELQFLDLSLLQGSGGDDVPPFRADSPLSSSPSVSVTYDQGSALSLAFRYEDFWDNDTYITNLAHTISIAPARYSNLLVQTIATNRPNTPAHQTVPFTVGFQDMHTNYVFVFQTRDAQGNTRTTVTTNSFKLAAHTGGDTDRDGIPNEWEITHFLSFTGAVATANPDGDWMNNLQEYVADTLPTNASSVLVSSIDAMESPATGTLQLDSPAPTSPNRRYDVWYSTNLTGPVVWNRVGLHVPGAANGDPVPLRVTNSLPGAFYRTGVQLP